MAHTAVIASAEVNLRVSCQGIDIWGEISVFAGGEVNEWQAELFGNLADRWAFVTADMHQGGVMSRWRRMPNTKRLS